MSENITIDEVRVRIAHHGERDTVAWADCVVNDAIALSNICIRRDANGGLTLRYPASRSRRGNEHFYFRPISAAAKATLDRAILGRLGELAGAS